MSVPATGTDASTIDASRIDKVAQARSKSLLVVVAGLGILASVALFVVMQRLERLRAEAQFLQMAGERLSAMRTNVDGALDITALLASHFAVADDNGGNRRAFSTLVAPAFDRHHYLQALEWIPRVRGTERSRLERLARADGVRTFVFRQQRSDGMMVAAGSRDQYYPVLYVEPVSGNERAIGYDLASNRVRFAAMTKARDTGLLTATARVRLVQEKADQWGTLIFAPVYNHPHPDTAASRRIALAGFGLSVIRIGDLVAAADYRHGANSAAMVDIHLFDLSAAEPDQQLYPCSGVTTPASLKKGLHEESSIPVGGRTWLLLATPGPGFNARPLAASSLLVLVFGLSLSGLSFRYLKAKTDQSAEIARAAREIELAQAELKQTNWTLEAVIQSSPLAVVTMDLEGRITMWNPAAESIHGWTKEDVLGRRLPVVLPNSPPDEVQRVHQKILDEGGVAGVEYACLTKDGQPITVSVAAAPLRNAAGEKNGAVYLVMDITERKRLESQLAQAQKLESIGQLAAGVAHEINTPIQYVGDNLRFLLESFQEENRLYQAYRRLVNAVRNGQPAETLAGECEAIALEVEIDDLWAEIPRALQQSGEGIDRVSRIVRAMKEFSHFGTVTKTPVEIAHAIESTLLVSRNEWKYVAEVKTCFDPSLPAVPCVPSELNQVILNLIVNAAHAIAEVVGSSPQTKGTISVSTRRDGDWAEIRVTDTGTGIPEAARAHIFNPFFTTKAVGKGTGQGLAIAHSVVVQKHGGSITFETEMGVGTTFIVRLPMGGTGETPADQNDKAAPAAIPEPC